MGGVLAGISFAILAFASGYMHTFSEKGSVDRFIWGLGYLLFGLSSLIFTIVGVFKV